MRTAIIKTGIWKDKTIRGMNIDTKLVYLCLITNPERNTTRYMQIDEDYICIQSGIDYRQLAVVKKQLQELGVIQFFEDWVIFSDDSYVSPATGKLSKTIHDRDLLLVPEIVTSYYDNRGENLQSRSSAALVYKDKDNNKDKAIDNSKDNNSLKEFRELNQYWSEQSGRKLSENKTSIAAYKKIRKEHDVGDIQLAINGAVFYQGVKYKPQVLSFASLYDKWDSLSGHMVMEGREKSNAQAPIF